MATLRNTYDHHILWSAQSSKEIAAWYGVWLPSGVVILEVQEDILRGGQYVGWRWRNGKYESLYIEQDMDDPYEIAQVVAVAMRMSNDCPAG